MFKVFIPSMSRAGEITTPGFFHEPIIVVPKRQEADYKKYYKNVLPVPDEIKGITKTRNFILEHCEKEGIRRHIEIDDDVKRFMFDEGNRRVILSEDDKEQIRSIIAKAFILTEEWGFHLFGFRLRSDKKDYREYAPFSTLCVIVANILGVITTKLRFDEDLPIKEDYDFSLQHILRDGGVLRLNKYAVEVSHLMDEGGCSEYRSKRMELEVLKKMQKKWGKNIVRHSGNKNIMKVRVPLKGI